MTTQTIAKTGRYQITLPKTPPITNRIESLLRKYNGMNLTEIIKLSLIKLDNETDLVDTTQDETDYIKSDPKLYARLLKAKTDFDNENFNPAFILDSNQIKNIHANLKSKGKILGKKFLGKKSIVEEVSEDEMYDLIKND
jgi:hypothetical protein